MCIDVTANKVPQKILSIAIPTFNRDTTLQACISMFAGQVVAGGRQQDIEIVIVDNASTDDTENVCAWARQQWSFVRYQRNQENVGMLRNIDHAVRASQGRFCWLFGDDDIVLPFALGEVLKVVDRFALDADSISFGVINAFVLNPVGTRFTNTTDRHCKLPTTIFENGIQIFENLDYHSIGHISRLIVNRSVWIAQDYEADRESFEVFSFIRLLLRGTEGRATFWIDSPLVGGRNKHSVAYYSNHLPLAFTIEFPAFDQTCLKMGARPRRIRHLQRARRRLTIRGALKMLLFQENYADYLIRIRNQRFSLWTERLAVKALFILLYRRPWSTWLDDYIEARQTNPLRTDRFLHDSV